MSEKCQLDVFFMNFCNGANHYVILIDLNPNKRRKAIPVLMAMLFFFFCCFNINLSIF